MHYSLCPQHHPLFLWLPCIPPSGLGFKLHPGTFLGLPVSVSSSLVLLLIASALSFIAHESYFAQW